MIRGGSRTHNLNWIHGTAIYNIQHPVPIMGLLSFFTSGDFRQGTI